MSKYEEPKETASKIRRKLKESFPELKNKHFKVVSSNSHMSISVIWEDYPSPNEVEKITNQYKGSSFDGSIDLESNHGYTDPDTKEHVNGYSYISTSFTLTEDRKRKIDAHLELRGTPKESLQEFKENEYRAYRKYSEMLDKNGVLLDKFVPRDFDDFQLKEMIAKHLKVYALTLTIPVPATFINQPKYLPVSTSFKHLEFEDDYKTLIEQYLQFLKKRNKDYKSLLKTEEDVETLVKEDTSNLQTILSLPLIEKIFKDFQKEKTSIFKTVLKEYMEIRKIKNVSTEYNGKSVSQFLENAVVDLNNDKDIARLVSKYVPEDYVCSGSWERMKEKITLNIVNDLDNFLNIEKDSYATPRKVQEIFNQFKNTSITLTVNKNNFNVSPVLISSSYIKDLILSSTEENNTFKIVTSPNLYSRSDEFHELEKSYINLSKLSYFEKHPDLYKEETFEKEIKNDIKTALVKTLERYTAVLKERTNILLIHKGMLERYLKSVNMNPIQTVKKYPSLNSIDYLMTEKISNYVYHGGNTDKFLKYCNNHYKKILLETPKDITSLRETVLAKELQYLKGNKALAERYLRIINKPAPRAIGKSYREDLLQNKHSFKYSELIGLEYKKENLAILIFPHACYVINPNEKTPILNIYSLRNNTIKECHENFTKYFKNVKDEEVQVFLRDVYGLALNFSTK